MAAGARDPAPAPAPTANGAVAAEWHPEPPPPAPGKHEREFDPAPTVDGAGLRKPTGYTAPSTEKPATAATLVVPASAAAALKARRRSRSHVGLAGRRGGRKGVTEALSWGGGGSGRERRGSRRWRSGMWGMQRARESSYVLDGAQRSSPKRGGGTAPWTSRGERAEVVMALVPLDDRRCAAVATGRRKKDDETQTVPATSLVHAARGVGPHRA